MSEQPGARTFPPSHVRPPDYPVDIPFLANVTCWIRDGDRGRSAIWRDEQHDGPVDVQESDDFPISPNEIRRIYAQSGDDRAALKASLMEMFINARKEMKGRGPVGGSGNGEAHDLDDRTAAIVAQSTESGWSVVADRALPARSSCLLQRGTALRFVAPGGPGVATMFDISGGGG